ncbi:MAG TPA: cyclic dehypoxanthinyl futalosine synthase [Patescibacteria group bacterium]|nr:cyclic dehypoxanthinyl futalosine synthase [Patescibacteria group bacterium]
MQRLRIATVPFVNAAPLVWGFRHGSLRDRVELLAVPPARIADLLRERRVDAGLVPVIATQVLEDHAIHPALGIASPERARSVLLISKRPLEEIRSIALDAGSRSSAALLKVILAARRLTGIVFTEQAPALRAMLETSDAALLIGDPALQAETDGLEVLDLAAEWRRLTRLPFLFAVWAVRRDAWPTDEGDLFMRSYLEGRERLDAIAAEAAPGLGLEAAAVAAYLKVNIRYELGAEEHRAADLFLGRAHEIGLIGPPRPLPLLDTPSIKTPERRSVRRSDAVVEEALAGAADGRRLTPDEALALLRDAPLLDLAMAADLVRRRLHPEPVVTYIVDRNVNYTNVCVARCSFCAFYREPGDPEGYLHSKETLFAKIEETLAVGGTGVLMQGGHHPDLPIAWYEDLLSSIMARFPTLHLHAFSPSEIQHIARVSRIPIDEVLARLKAAGLKSIPGGGGEILVDEVRRRISPLKTMSDDWLGVMESAHRLGLPTTATMMFGHVESYADRVEHLARVRDLQDRSLARGARGFTAFIAWTYKAENTALGGGEATSAEYLRTQAVCRLFLDNIPNIQSSWVTQGKEIGQVALKFGANDMGSIMIEENVVKAAGAHGCTTRTEMERLIREAGYQPRQRDTLYNPVA